MAVAETETEPTPLVSIKYAWYGSQCSYDDDDDDSGVEPTTLCCHGLHLTKKRDHTHARGIAPFGTRHPFLLWSSRLHCIFEDGFLRPFLYR